MHGFDDVLATASGEERDAMWRSLERDMTEAADARGAGPGFVMASRPADVARALGRDRRRTYPQERAGRRLGRG